MGITKQLALNTVPQNVIVQTVCADVIIKEDESVASWPTTNLIVKKPAVTGDANVITAGKQYNFPAPPGWLWRPGDILGQVYLPAGSTTGIQDER